jgi:pimeloyl-ACP methyl ester carboxylesterase
VASLSGVAEGHAAKERYEASNAEFDPEMFTAADHAALSGPWGSWLDDGVGPAVEAGPGGLTADVLAYVAPWGADPARITAPTLLLHGGRDRVIPRSHGEWLARRCPSAELWLYPDDGYCSVLNQGAAALTWIKEHADREAEPRAAAEQEGPTVATLEEAP